MTHIGLFYELGIWTSSVELKGELGWCKFAFYKTSCCSLELVKDNVERISYLEVDEDTFIERFEEPNLPVVITDAQKGWEANRKWTIEVDYYKCLRSHNCHMTCRG